MKKSILKITVLSLLFGVINISIKAQNESQLKQTVTPEIVDIGSKLELFTDYYLIENLDNVSLKLHEPIDKGTVLKFDKSWEGPFSAYCTVIKDNDLFRLYYRGVPTAGKDGRTGEHTCYAESKDGINWTKPDLKIYEIDGTLNNNIVLSNAVSVTHNFSPFIDTRKNVNPIQKYKALGGTGKSGLIAYVSENGIHWEKLQDKPVFTEGVFDSQNVSFWSESEQQYLCYFRTWTESGYSGFRSVSRTTSKDFINWTKPIEMDFGDTQLEHLYTNQTSPYFRAPHIYISVAARFMPGRKVISEEEANKLNVNPKYFNDCSDAVLMTTRGGNKYDRTFMESFIRPGIGLQNWVSRSNYPALNIVQTGAEEMSVYVNQDYAQPSAHLHRYAMRIDGFTSVRASYKGGEMITKPLRFNGDKLYLNFSTSAAGFVKVEILDLDGNKIKGFELENSSEIIGNEIEKEVSWNENPDLRELNGVAVRLRFVMKDADLYSIKFK
ncbi:MAG: hypothetical protein HN778_13940 [Prolixibacteraceae bacterium]|nr:hypothetical protein [Prolixibacteraceae bacterium]MBT6766777.1 hypothetical protein [Prolixibacteraceae bacterium]MBT7000494.1 hypothetical protein [Prolixibacteraceae bacterium]MBT7395928.1 hypothetical protein [Prolixibacteraceae bacterium]